MENVNLMFWQLAWVQLRTVIAEDDLVSKITFPCLMT